MAPCASSSQNIKILEQFDLKNPKHKILLESFNAYNSFQKKKNRK